MIRQGVTTMVLGESRSAGPIKAGRNDDPRVRADGVDGRLDDARRLLSAGSSGSTWRRTSRRMSAKNRSGPTSRATAESPATPAELEEMKKLIAQAMEDGAMGLSTALLQPPSSLATTDNLIELAKVAKQYGGIYASHIRDEGERVFRSVDEAIQVGQGSRTSRWTSST